MSTTSSALVNKLWNYCNILRDDGLSYGDYVEQLTFLLFLKMAHERTQPPYNQPSAVPEDYSWPTLVELDGIPLEHHYRRTLETLGKEPGMLRTIFRKALNKIQDPAKLKRLIADLIDKETWSTLDADVKGDIYEGLLQKNAEDVKSGAGQYFTPRPLIQAIVDVMRPGPGVTIMDPAAGTGGFLLAAKDPNNYEMVLTNPPFGKKSSVTIINEEGDESREALNVYRDDFWATTSNKQLNFVQHIASLLKMNGRAAVVVPDNVLFEGGAGETIRRKLLHSCDVHTLLRLPTGIFYAQGVKANVIFFDRKPASETPWTKALWIYDLRTNKHFTLKTNPLRRPDLDDFIACYHAENRFDRKETGRFHCFNYEDLLKRDKLSLDITWLRDESLEDTDNLPDPAVLAAEIVEDLQAALDQFALIAADLAKGPNPINRE